MPSRLVPPARVTTAFCTYNELRGEKGMALREAVRAAFSALLDSGRGRIPSAREVRFGADLASLSDIKAPTLQAVQLHLATIRIAWFPRHHKQHNNGHIVFET